MLRYEIAVQFGYNLVQARSVQVLFDQAIEAYHLRIFEVGQRIEILLDLAQTTQAAGMGRDDGSWMQIKLKTRAFNRRPLISTTASVFTETRRKVLPLKLYHYHFYAIY